MMMHALTVTQHATCATTDMVFTYPSFILISFVGVVSESTLEGVNQIACGASNAANKNDLFVDRKLRETITPVFDCVHDVCSLFRNGVQETDEIFRLGINAITFDGTISTADDYWDQDCKQDFQHGSFPFDRFIK